jgi:hypothetical protein
MFDSVLASDSLSEKWLAMLAFDNTERKRMASSPKSVLLTVNPPGFELTIWE